jgi:hypothetical protein
MGSKIHNRIVFIEERTSSTVYCTVSEVSKPLISAHLTYRDIPAKECIHKKRYKEK